MRPLLIKHWFETYGSSRFTGKEVLTHFCAQLWQFPCGSGSSDVGVMISDFSCFGISLVTFADLCPASTRKSILSAFLFPCKKFGQLSLGQSVTDTICGALPLASPSPNNYNILIFIHSHSNKFRGAVSVSSTWILFVRSGLWCEIPILVKENWHKQWYSWYSGIYVPWFFFLL